jgi:uncharacterized protein (UPF0261 family)
MMEPQQMEFASLAFPKDRTVLYIGEVAERLRITEQHVSDLIEEGKLQAIDISGGAEYMERFIDALAESLQKAAKVAKEELKTQIRSAIGAARAQTVCTRRYWRVPKEAYDGFLKANHSWNV